MARAVRPIRSGVNGGGGGVGGALMGPFGGQEKGNLRQGWWERHL